MKGPNVACTTLGSLYHYYRMLKDDTMQKKSEKIIFTLYLLGFLGLALTVALMQPLANTPPLYGNPPDEHARYLIPQFICKYGRIPTGLEEEVRIPAYGFSYALYNVFPYIIQGYVMRFVNLFTESEVALLYTARLVNVTFGLLMAVVVYFIGKKVFRDAGFRWMFCFAVTYLPEGLFLHTYVNTDSCCMLSTAMMVYALVCVYQDGINVRNSLWMSGGIILCALSYYNAYGYIVSCILLFVAFFLQKKENGGYSYDWKRMLKYGCLIAGVVLIGISWWFIRSYIVLDGDLLGLKTREKMAIQYAIESVNPLTMKTYQAMGYSVSEMLKERYTFTGLYHSFVAAFGSMSIFGTIWLYRAYKMFFAAGCLGVVVYLVRYKQRRHITGKEWFFHINMLYCILMPAILTIYYAYTMDYQNQGRYLLPALVPLMYYTVKGIQKLSEIKIGKLQLPAWLVNAGIAVCFLIIIGSAVDMVYIRALPVYLETGLVLK